MRLIDADALTELHCEGCTEDVRDICKGDPGCASLMWVAEAPTIEAEPVRHGRWVTQWCDNNMIGHEYAECSVCGCSMLDTNQFWNSKYCPNCGAKMDGDDHAV
jgi:hypothetical protein